MGLTGGIIGCSNIAQFHFSGLEKAGVKIKLICDLAEDRAKPWVSRYGARWRM